MQNHGDDRLKVYFVPRLHPRLVKVLIKARKILKNHCFHPVTRYLKLILKHCAGLQKPCILEQMTSCRNFMQPTRMSALDICILENVTMECWSVVCLALGYADIHFEVMDALTTTSFYLSTCLHAQHMHATS